MGRTLLLPTDTWRTKVQQCFGRRLVGGIHVVMQMVEDDDFRRLQKQAANGSSKGIEEKIEFCQPPMARWRRRMVYS